MARTQTSYTENIRDAVAGMVGTSTVCVIDSYEATGTAGIKYGYGVKRTTTVGQIAAGADGASSAPFAVTDFLGVTVRDMGREGTDTAADTDEYAAGEVAGVLSQGDIWVPVEAQVTAGHDVSVDETTGQLSSQTAADDQFLVKGRWMTSQSSANGLALLRLFGEIA